MYKILDKVDTPQDLRKLDLSELPGLCDEIRDYIVRCCADNPGHLASSLGAVELIVGMHYVFDTPSDKLVFDVGHQAYAHKIITGRKEAFKGNRKKDGISGFPNRDESPYDAFGAGHASTSISAALGLAKAAQVSGLKEKVVAMIGDGAMTGGLALEGLNNAGDSDTDILVVLNDNDMAIDGNRGALHSYLLKVTTDPAYNKIKTHVWESLGAGRFRNWVQGMVRKAKSGLVTNSGGDFFEAFGFRYFGPIDGNDIGEVVNTLRRLKDIKGPKILHTCTVKGKGYAPAEADPTTWHAPGKFDPETGERDKNSGTSGVRYQDVFGAVLCELARKDPKVVGITPAMATGSGLADFAEEFPDRFFDVGIAEEHAVTFASGLATKGIIPFFAVYSTFLQRGFDQLIHDAAIQKLHVVLCIDRAGIVGDDGETHQGVFDVSMLNTIPETTIFSPCYFDELKHSMNAAAYMCDSLVGVRYPRGGELYRPDDFKVSSIDFDLYGDENAEICIVTYGRLFSYACKARERLKDEGLNVSIIKLCRIKPIDCKAVKIASKSDKIFFFEESLVAGGIGESFGYELKKTGCDFFYKIHGIKDAFVRHETVEQALNEFKLDDDGMIEVIKEYI